MANWCITTVVSGNHFQYYVPLFVFTAKRAYPDAFVKVFVVGNLKHDVKTALATIRSDGACDANWEIVEDAFPGIPLRVSTCNSLRQLVPEEQFKDFEYVYVTDADILMLPHDPSHLRRFKTVIKRNGQPIASYRGPLKARSNGLKCTGINTRMACYAYLLKVPEWFDRTRSIRGRYLDLITRERHDDYDRVIPCSFREYDEVMLYRICRESGITIPESPNHFQDGTRIEACYRDIHLGDFKFGVRWKNMPRMKRRIPDENVKAYRELCADPYWPTVLKYACVNDEIDMMIDRVNAHIRKRVKKCAV